MSVIIRLQNLPWSANALDIRNYFRGLSIPEGGVHIVGGELGDAFIAFSTDEDARQAMMLDCGKIKEIQVKLHLSSRSEMHKVIEAARQTVPILTLTAPVAPAAPVAPVVAAAPVVVPPALAPVAPAVPTPPPVTPFSAALGSSLSSFGIPGIGNPQEIPQPAVIEPPAPMVSPPVVITPEDNDKDDEKPERKRSKEKDRKKSRSRSRSRDRDRKDRKRDRRDRSRSRDRDRKDRKRDRRDRSRSRDRKRRDRSRSRDRSPSRRSRDRRNNERKLSPALQEKPFETQAFEAPTAPPPPAFGTNNPVSLIQLPTMVNNPMMPNGPQAQMELTPNRFSDPSIADAYNKLQELGKKRNPNAFQGEQHNGGGRFPRGRGNVAGGGRGGGGDGHMGRGAPPFRRDGRQSRFDSEPQRDCCVAIKNAPNHTSYGDVRRFFPFMIDKHGIKMINDNMGRRTGNIFVRFCDPRSKQLALQRKNNELKGAEVVVEALDDESYEAAIDSFLPYREENDEEEQGLVIIDGDETPRAEFSVLKLTDLPHYVKEHDIIKIFSDFSLLSIMLNDCRVTRSKIAFVQFVKSADARQAFEQKDRYVFGKRHPTITPVTEEEYEKEKIIQNEKEPDAVMLKEKRIEIEAPQEPVVPRDPRQRRPQLDNGAGPQAQPPQQAQSFFPGPFVQGQPFAAPFHAPQFGTFPGNSMDPRTAAANWANRPAFPNPMPAPARNSNIIDLDDEPLDCVLMKGLPTESTDRTIVTFLSDTGAVPARIHLMLDANSMPSGDCFCEFRTTQEARMAATKHGHDLDGNRVTVDLVARSVVEEALEGPKQADVRNSPSGLLGNGPPQPQFFDAPRGGYQHRGSFRGRGGYDRGFDRGSYGGRGGFDSGQRFGSGRGFDPDRNSYDSGRGGFDSGRGFRGRGGFDRGNRFDRSRGRGFSRGRGGFDRGRGRFEGGRGGFEGGRGEFENGRDREMKDEEQDPALEDFGAPGCVVSMENVPFRASVDDIMNFFSEFELTQDDIIRRYNERGQPTGDARVAFRTPFDAQRAVKTRHMDTIHERRINLTIL